MREIRFRAWDKEHKAMEYIDDLYWFEEAGVHDFGGQGHYSEYVLQQFTGLYDSKQNPIYEGDIVRYKERNLEKAFNLTSGGDDFIKKTKEIWFYGQSFNVPEGFVKDLEVIGNCFEHPHLLEASES
ncbi:YopX family protein [Pseudobacillus badius]|uniref:YopX family protein n=1 Tax=Bacillus badius TaxID=1455 RepID=UPI0024A36462|nr:YopX family protein [Bacillus badius]GLY11352.1 hypothetical protein Bbad01_25680 [Bacillus badius]